MAKGHAARQKPLFQVTWLLEPKAHSMLTCPSTAPALL
jgi:hypothetical protein